MTKDEFISYAKGVIDGEMINLQSEELSPPLRLIKSALDSVDTSETTYKVPINNEVPDMVPYHTVCPCSKENGGGGICGCVMPNKMVPNPKKYHTTVGTSTTLNTDIKFDTNTSYQKSAIAGIQSDLDKILETKYDISYENYVKTVTKNRVVEEMEYPGDCEYRFVIGTVLEDIGGKYDLYAIPLPKEQFIERIKTDEEFAKRWEIN